MKTIKFTLAALLALFLIPSCTEDKDEQMTNHLNLELQGVHEIAEDDNTTITIKASLSFTPEEDVTANLIVTGNDDKIVELSTQNLVFKKGEKVQTFTIKSNNKHLVKGVRSITINVGHINNDNVKLLKPVTINIRQDSDIPVLTEAQQSLIKGYKEKFGVDLTSILGKIKVKATVSYNASDKEQYFGGKEKETFNGYTIITLSEKATADKPVLKMISNAMGLNDFFYMVLKKKTVEDTEFFQQQPNGLAVVKAVKFDPKEDTFTTALDNIELNIKDGKINFLGTGKDVYGDEITVVPFSYKFSAWDRLQNIVKQGNVSVTIKLPYEDHEQTILINQDVIDAGGSISPNRWLGYSTIDKDSYKNDPSDYIKPTSVLDFKGGKMSFTFPWDFDEANGYTQINVEYTF